MLGGCHKKKTALHLNLVKHDVVFAIMEANLTTEKLIYYQLNGYTLYNLLKHRQIASRFLTGVSNSLCTHSKIVKETGNSEDKSERVKVKVWKQGNNFTIYATYNPPNNKPDFTSLIVTSKTIIIGDFNAYSSKWGYKDTNRAGKETEDFNLGTDSQRHRSTHIPSL